MTVGCRNPAGDRAIARLFPFLAVIAVLAAAPATGDERAELRLRCLDWMDRGYPSGLDEATCRSEFSLPSAYLVKCGRGLTRGFASDRERAACAQFLSDAGARAATGYVIRGDAAAGAEGARH